jgi:hypothetical protein
VYEQRQGRGTLDPIAPTHLVAATCESTVPTTFLTRFQLITRHAKHLKRSIHKLRIFFRQIAIML